jgi:hypothetical protein
LRPTVVVARLLDRTLHVLRAKAVRPRRIRSSAMNCGRCESSRASRPRHSYSPLSGVARSPPQASPSCSPAPAMRPRLASLRSTHTCYRNACGYALANKGIDTRTIGAYLGHRSINRSKRYWRFSNRVDLRPSDITPLVHAAAECLFCADLSSWKQFRPRSREVRRQRPRAHGRKVRRRDHDIAVVGRARMAATHEGSLASNVGAEGDRNCNVNFLCLSIVESSDLRCRVSLQRPLPIQLRSQCP